ncbi:MAG: hypothetical protein KDD70_04910 [Bdellovibrionales bacterium]|nr:hypothetical protein [Bdellovibrionales bacterium]
MRILSLLFAAVLLCCTSWHTSLPIFRDLIFEQLRDYGALLISGWALLLFIAFLRLIHRQKKRETILLGLLCLSAIFYLSIPLFPYFFLSEQVDPEDGDGLQELRFLLTEGDFSKPEIEKQHTRIRPNFWFATHKKSGHKERDLLTAKGDFACAYHLGSSDEWVSTVFAEVSCDAFSSFWLVPSHIEALKIVIPLARHEATVYFVRMLRGEGEEVYYHNFLAFRRLTSIIRQLPNVVLVTSDAISPWTRLHQSLAAGGRLHDVMWNEWGVRELLMLPPFGEPYYDSVFFKGVLRKKSLAMESDFQSQIIATLTTSGGSE